jgi:hypothetical protein
MRTISASPPASSAVELRASGASGERTADSGVNAPGNRTFRKARHGRDAGGSCRAARVEGGFDFGLVVLVCVDWTDEVGWCTVSRCGIPSTDEPTLCTGAGAER